MKNYPEGTGAWSHDHFSKIWDPLYKYGTGEARNFKFGIRIDLGKDTKYPHSGPGKGQGPFFKFWDPSLNIWNR